MIDRETFDGHVRDALAHLDDPLHLDGHPLLGLLTSPGEETSPEALRHALRGAIAGLKPPAATPDSADWRRYEYLRLRYVERRAPADIARLMHVSPRQTRRDHQIALDALAASLWARRRALMAARPPRVGAPPAGGVSRLEPADGTASDEAGLEAELLAMGLTPPERPTIVEEVVKGAVDAVAGLAASVGLRLEVSLPPSVAPVAVHELALRHAVLGVLNWAIESGCQRVDLTAEDGVDGARLTFALWSPALPAGLPAAEALAGGPDRPLWPARRLIELQGGGLAVRSGQAGSVEVQVTLPGASVATVLVVDDNPDAVRLFRRYLARTGYRVLHANTGQRALALAHDDRPDAITLDLMMPLQDGLELLKCLKADPTTAGIPVIVCSVLREQALAISLGADQFLVKPVSQQALLAALDRGLRSEER